MINFQLNQSKPFISLLTFGNADHKNGLTSFRIQCRIFLCWGKSGTGILGPASAVLLRPEVSDGPWIPCQQQMKNVSQQTDQREKTKKYKPWRKYPSSSQMIRAWRTMGQGNMDIFKSIFRYQSQHDTVIPPLKPIGQTFVKVDNQAKVVATKITIDSRSPAVSLN